MISYVVDFVKKYKQHLPAVALVAGLVWDSITLGRPDQLYGNIVLLTYLLIAGFCIALMAHREVLKKKSKIWLSLIVQFAFGNLTGGLLVLYIGSATLAQNWPFLLILAGLLVGNEIFKSRYRRVQFNILVYYLLVFLYSILIVPVVFRSIESWTFLVSALLSIVVISLFLYIIRLVAKKVFKQSKKMFKIGIFSTLFIFSIFYYLNIIPPVPLAVRDVGIFHSVVRSGGDYFVTYEEGAWYKFWWKSDSTIYLKNTNTASCFSSVFAPTELETPIFHVWEMYDKNSGMWEERGRFNFPIVGGRVDGYRGYSEKTITEGMWRCSVETERGALLGRVSIEAILDTPPEFVTDLR